MSQLQRELIFCHGPDKVPFPAGTPIHEPREKSGDAVWNAELKVCESRCRELNRVDRTNGDVYETMIVGGRPRVLHKRFFDPLFRESTDDENAKPSQDLASGNDATDQQGSDASDQPIETDGAQDGQGSRGLPGGPDKIAVSGSRRDGGRKPEPGASEPLCYGLVVVVDLMNVLVRAWFAGTPSKIHAVKSLLGTCANIIERLSPEYLIFAADGGHAERSRLFPAYKAHREAKPEGLQEQIDLAELVLESIGWPVIRVVEWEADDVVASLASELGPTAAGVVIASSDKDLLQLVGSHGIKVYHPWGEGAYFGSKQVREKFGVEPSQVADYLALVGDTSDGIPGVKGIGPKKAAELIAAHGDLPTILEEARLQRIIGAAGKHLREQVETARLSRQLVELRRDIPIPQSWTDWRAVEPRAGWVDQLRHLDLGAVVQRLCEVIPSTGRVRSGSASIELHWEYSACELENVEVKLVPVPSPDGPTRPRTTPTAETSPAADDSLSSDRENDSELSAGDVRTERSTGSPYRTIEHDASRGSDGTDSIMENERPKPGLDIQSAECPADWVRDFPPLARMSRDASSVELCRSVYAEAYRDRLNGRTVANPWRTDSKYHAAWQLGYSGEPFEMAIAVKPSVPSSKPASADPNRRRRPRRVDPHELCFEPQ